MQPDQPPPAPNRWVVTYAQLTADLVGPVLLGLLLDWQFGWLPWGTVTGLILGLAISMYHLALLARRLDRPEPPDRGRGPT